MELDDCLVMGSLCFYDGNSIETHGFFRTLPFLRSLWGLFHL